MGDHTGAPRRRAWGMILAAVVALAALSGCAAAPGMSDTSVASAASSRHYHSPRYGLAIAYPQGVPAARRFEADYFLGTRWNPDAAAAVPRKKLEIAANPTLPAMVEACARLCDAAQSLEGGSQAQ